MRSSSVEEVASHGAGDPWEVFSALAILVVEGRTPGGERGYHAGTHCPLPHQLQHKHSCEPNDHLCQQADALVRQLRVMWGVGVGVSLEVLVAPECHHGAALAATLDTTTAPSHNLRLIEQWNFTIYDRRLPEATATGWSLIAAVRSFLHFSQLSAWLSVSRGRRPPNVLYRLTVTSPVFCSKFLEEAEEHVFPITYMGQDTSIKVLVRSLPRSEEVPVVLCQESHEEEVQTNTRPLEGPSCSQHKADGSKGDEDLRRSVMKARLAENSRVRSESPDTQLGESLLDPPNSLNRFPRRYQSPSRSGSPSLETPEHLICRHRSPTTPNRSRPPDPSSSAALSLPSPHPFSWTQARYPLPPVGIHHHQLSLDAINNPTQDGMQPQSQQQTHNPYRLDYPGPYQVGRRPQHMYNRPQMCWPQAQQQLPQQKPQLHTNLPLTPMPHSQAYNLPQKLQPRISPRGGKYQHYPEYQTQELSDYHQGSEEEREPHEAMHGEYPECNPYSGLRIRGEYPELPCKLPLGSRTDQRGNPESYAQSQGYREDCFCSRGEYDEVDTKGSFALKNKKCKCKDLDSSRQTGDEAMNSSSVSKVIDDELWPCCSHTGKHLCTSFEDLPEACDYEMPVQKKDLKPSVRSKGDVSPSHLYHSKFNFELTPRETMEILSVLRAPTPVPPLRIERHRSLYEMEPPRCSSDSNNMKTLPADRRKPRYYKEGNPEVSSWTEKEELLEYKHEKEDASMLECTLKASRKKMGPKKLSTCGQSKEKYHKVVEAKDGLSSGSSPENRFLEAIALSGEKHCDTPSFKNLAHSCESSWTRVSRENTDSLCDIKGDLDEKINATKSDERGRHSEESCTERGRHSEESCTTHCPAVCIEAKKITHKTNFFTASSEPAKAINSQPQRQTSQTLVRSPFSAILNSIQKEYNQLHEEELSKKDEGYDSPGVGVKAKAKRALDFNEDVVQPTTTDTNKKLLAYPHERKEQRSQENGCMTEHVRETREGLTKSKSLLNHLITQGRPYPQDNISQDYKQPKDLQESKPNEQKEVDQENSHQRESIENGELNGHLNHQYLDEEDDEVGKICDGKGVPIPSASEKAQFRRSLDSATNMVFHCKTGLPLTSSPAPLRKGKRFDYDSSLTSVAAIKRSTSFHCSALYTCDSEEEEGADKLGREVSKPTQLSTSAPATVACSNLLGSFEECVLNGRLEPVSTVQGFTAEIAASGAFCPKRTTKPVTVFFYTLCDNDQISSPYMGHINLGKKGYHVPNKGTIQVTLFNPHGTVVKMFVVMYDLSDMPPNSRTFLRQRTLNMPCGATDSDSNAHQWLRYLIHLRFVTSKSGKIYLHTDIRMLIFRKSDADAATLHKTNVPYELRSFTHGPTNPKFSPRK